MIESDSCVLRASVECTTDLSFPRFRLVSIGQSEGKRNSGNVQDVLETTGSLT
jgi:hypothetical protein